jgi:multiple sugar transport system substrate-binding protein
LKKYGSIKALIIFLIIAVLSAGVMGCSNKKFSKEAEKQQKFAGSEIQVLLPPWYAFSDEMLAEFEKETGIKVKLETLDWEPLQDKIVTSCAAKTAPADVTEFSWDWVGKFGEAGWYEPLNKYFDEDFMSDISTRDIFKYKDDYLAIPIYNDFRLTYINKQRFEQAGIRNIPATPEELMEAAKQIKAKGIDQYPFIVPFSATSATTTPWFLLTKSFGGELFDQNWEPLFESKDSAGYKAMDYLVKGLFVNKVIDPASIGYKGTDVVENYKQGIGTIDLAGWAGNVQDYKNPEKSKVANEVEVIKVPGINGKSRTYGLQEAVGIPAASKNKEAAAEFIRWLNTPQNVKRLFLELGIFPNHKSTISELVKEDKLPGGETVLEVMPTIEPLFPQGAPEWYSAFETDVATTMNQIAKKTMSTDEGIKHIADNARKLAKESKK